MSTEVDSDELRDAVERLHGCPAKLVRAVPVPEAFEGRPAWYGASSMSSTLAGIGRPTDAMPGHHGSKAATGARVFAVLQTPSIASPADAVHAAILQETAAPDRGGDQISTLTHLDDL